MKEGDIFISLVDTLSGDGICYDISMSMACDLESDVSKQQKKFLRLVP